jgi:hypothetical protein
LGGGGGEFLLFSGVFGWGFGKLTILMWCFDGEFVVVGGEFVAF